MKLVLIFFGLAIVFFCIAYFIGLPTVFDLSPSYLASPATCQVYYQFYDGKYHDNWCSGYIDWSESILCLCF